MFKNARHMSFDEMSQSAAVDPNWVKAGNPEEASALLHVSEDGKFVVQVWECVGPLDLEIPSYPCDEFISIIDGQVDVCDENGEIVSLASGDNFFIPKGYAGPWRQAGRLRKYSVCYLN